MCGIGDRGQGTGARSTEVTYGRCKGDIQQLTCFVQLGWRLCTIVPGVVLYLFYYLTYSPIPTSSYRFLV